MRVVQFSTSDGPGGAGKAAARLHSALRSDGHESWMIVRDKTSDDPAIAVAPRNRLIALCRRAEKNLIAPWRPAAKFTFNFDRDSGARPEQASARLQPPWDAMIVHWASGLLTIRSLARLSRRLNAPLLWVMMDQEPVTGGCHYSFGCERYRQSCGDCPLLVRPGPRDASRRIWERKQRFLSQLPLTLIAPTSWCEQKARASSLFAHRRIERIPLPVDHRRFAPGPRDEARRSLGLPLDRRILFFGASYLHDPRKGGDLLLEALRLLFAALDAPPRALPPENVLLLVAGRNPDPSLASLPFPSRFLGHQNEQDLAAAYRAADLFVCPSVEDAGPMMLAESMLCGTPVVAFDTGGAPDLIEPGQNGYLARLKDVRGLAAGMRSLLSHGQPGALAAAARAKALALHTPAIVAGRYARLIAELAAAANQGQK